MPRLACRLILPLGILAVLTLGSGEAAAQGRERPGGDGPRGEMRGGRADFRPPNDPLLRRVFEASRTLRWQGEVRLVMEREGDRFESIERVQRDGMRARIEVLKGPRRQGQITFETGERRFFFDPKANTLRPSMMRGAGWTFLRFVPPGQALRWENGPQIAGFGTQTAVLRDDRGEERGRVWVAPSQNFLMRMEFTAPDGRMRMAYEVRKVQFNPRFAAGVFELPKGARVLSGIEDLISAARQAQVPAYALPPDAGYRLSVVRVAPLAGRPGYRAAFDHSEGVVSLWVVKGQEPVRVQSGGKDASGRTVNVHVWREKDHTLILVAARSQDALRALAEKVRPINPRPREGRASGDRRNPPPR
jgi:hypothetical protein